MSRFARSLSAEFRKATATPTWWILGLVLLLYSAMMAAVFAFLFSEAMSAMSGLPAGDDAAGGGAALDVPSLIYSTVTAFGYVVPLVFGALIATGELRHRTLGLTFLAEPARGLVLLSKTCVLLIMGGVFGALGLVGAVGAGAPVLIATDQETALDSGDTWLLLARVVAAIAVWAVIGFGVGLLVRNQVFAVVLALVFTQFIEPVLRIGAQYWEWSAQLAKYLPGAASDAFVGASVMNDLNTADPSLPASSAALGMGPGFAVLAAYAVVTIVIGLRTTWQRDITT